MASRRACLLLLLAAIAAAANAGLGIARSEALSIDGWSVRACAATSTTDELDNGCFLANAPSTSMAVSPFISLSAFTAIQSVDATANAFQSPFGYDRAGASATGTLDLAAAAAAEFNLTVRSNSTEPEALTFRFLISNAALALAIGDYVALSDDVPLAQITSTVTTISISPTGRATHWSYSAFLAARSSDLLVGLQDNLNFVDPQGIGKLGIDSMAAGLGKASVDFAPFVGTLDLGMLAPGGLLTLTYTIAARTYTGVHDPIPRPTPNPPTVELHALIEDPFSLDSGFFLNGKSLASLLQSDEESVPTVPAPASWMLLTIGLVVSAITRRARR